MIAKKTNFVKSVIAKMSSDQSTIFTTSPRLAGNWLIVEFVLLLLLFTLPGWQLELALFCGYIANISGTHTSHLLRFRHWIYSVILGTLSGLSSRSRAVEIAWIKISDKASFLFFLLCMENEL